MEHIVNNASTPPNNLHPIWLRHFGIQTLQPTKPQAKPRHAGEALMQAVKKLATAHRPTTR